MAEASHTKAVAAPFSIALAPPHAADSTAPTAAPVAASVAAPVAGEMEAPLIEPSHTLSDSMPAGTHVVRPIGGGRDGGGGGIGGGGEGREKGGGRAGKSLAKKKVECGEEGRGWSRVVSIAGCWNAVLQCIPPSLAPVSIPSSALFIRLPSLHCANPPFSSLPSTGLIPISPLRPIPLNPPQFFPPATGEDQLRPLHPHPAPPAGQSGARLHGEPTPLPPFTPVVCLSSLRTPWEGSGGMGRGSAELVSVCAAFTVRTMQIDGSQLLHTWQLFDWTIDTTIPTASIIRVSLCKMVNSSQCELWEEWGGLLSGAEGCRRVLRGVGWTNDTSIPTTSIQLVSLCGMEKRFDTTYFCRVAAADGKQLDFGGHLPRKECERRSSTTYFCRVAAADGKQLDFGGHLSLEENVWLQHEVSSYLLSLAAESV
ncbi:unnamed protein product [Closterium sp. NIES-64]|nr:unnamed protein product [Closterium sp. NIES-64]